MASTLHLTIAATIAVHLTLAIVVDAVGVVSKSPPRPPPPRVSLVDIDVSQLRPPPPPPPSEPAPTTPPPPAVATPAPPTRARTAAPPRRVATAPVPPPSELPPTDAPPATGGGDAPIFRMDVGAPGRGAAVAPGPTTPGRTGGGGSGGGSGGGVGSGVGSGVEPRPVSVAAIKTPAKPTGDFDYFDAGKEYPAEARALGIEGVIKAKLIVDADGKVVKATLIKKLGHGLDELALKRARALTFTPAKDDADRPVSSIVVWEFTFTLPP